LTLGRMVPKVKGPWLKLISAYKKNVMEIFKFI